MGSLLPFRSSLYECSQTHQNGTHGGRDEEQQHNCFHDEHGALVIVVVLLLSILCEMRKTKPEHVENNVKRGKRTIKMNQIMRT
jgi:hypothetical protein